ncbi:hypothetical protein N0824_00831 [Microcystis sp. 0824]|nr:hypothetical protein N0824_00831 [Microcystis sp. 0824]
MKIEGERSYFCTNINLIICVQTEVNLNWIGGEEVLNDIDIVINFGEGTKANLTIGHYPPFFCSTRSSQPTLVRVPKYLEKI